MLSTVYGYAVSKPVDIRRFRQFNLYSLLGGAKEREDKKIKEAEGLCTVEVTLSSTKRRLYGPQRFLLSL